METLGVVLLAGAAVALVAGIVVLARRAAAARLAGLESTAREAGWSFSADLVEPDALGVGAFPLFSHGRRGRARNVSRGTTPAPIVVFDFSYTIQAGKHQRTVTQTVVHIDVRGAPLPPFVLAPENVFHKVGGLFGYHDIDFDASPEFSSKYLLRSKEEEPRVRDLFHPSVRAWFEMRGALAVESGARGVIVYRDGRTVRPEQLRMFVEEAVAVAAQFAS